MSNDLQKCDPFLGHQQIVKMNKKAVSTCHAELLTLQNIFPQILFVRIIRTCFTCCYLRLH